MSTGHAVSKHDKGQKNALSRWVHRIRQRIAKNGPRGLTYPLFVLITVAAAIALAAWSISIPIKFLAIVGFVELRTLLGRAWYFEYGTLLPKPSQLPGRLRAAAIAVVIYLVATGFFIWASIPDAKLLIWVWLWIGLVIGLWRFLHMDVYDAPGAVLPHRH